MTHTRTKKHRYKNEYYMETIADVNPRLLRAFDLTLLILLCVLYFVRVEIVRHQWYVEALMLSLGVLTALSGLILGGEKEQPAQILAFLRPLIFMISARPIRKYCQLCARSVMALSDVVPVRGVRAWCSSVVFENFNHVTHFNTHFVVKSTRIPTHSYLTHLQ